MEELPDLLSPFLQICKKQILLDSFIIAKNPTEVVNKL